MLKTEISTCGNSKVVNNNNGTSSIPKTGRENQPRVNGIEIGASRLTLTSTSFQLLEKADTLTIPLLETS